MNAASHCIALLGGSFDPVHIGHVALGSYFAELLFPDELRLIPAGNPWQKPLLKASAENRIAMLRLAFCDMRCPVAIDRQEVERHGPTYTIDTLRAIRMELGPQTSLAFLIGADQLQKLDTWKDWRQLFSLAHVCVASRPGFNIDEDRVPQEVAQEFARRMTSPEQIRSTPSGLTYLAANLALDVSATDIRTSFQRGESASSVPPSVLDYVKNHHLYQN